MFLYYVLLPVSAWKIRRLKPDLVFIQEALPFLPFLVRLLTGCRVLVEASDWWFLIYFGGTRLGRQFARFMTAVDIASWGLSGVTVGVHTLREKKMIVDGGVAEEKTLFVDVPCPVDDYHPVDSSVRRRELGFAQEDLVCAVHGVMHPSKGYEELLGWWSDYITRHPAWKLLLIGGTSREANYRDMAETLGLREHVVFSGWVPDHVDVNALLNVADVLLVTRRNSPENEGVVPSSLHHNLAVGKPTIVTGLPGMSEFIDHGRTGYCFVPGKAASLESILCGIEQDRASAAAVGLAGMEVVRRRFNVDSVCDQYLRYFAGGSKAS